MISYVELGTIADVKGGKRLPKGINLITEPNSHPYIRVRDLNNAIFASLSQEYEYVDDETQKLIAKQMAERGDVVSELTDAAPPSATSGKGRLQRRRPIRVTPPWREEGEA